ncbi:MAG TPA: photosynthetic complex assembly protein PuhC [Beijerinckiaceae bacterium]|jgi:putative photosynthetic complex assembly protein
MSQAVDGGHMPRGAALGIVSLLAFAILAAGAGRIGGLGFTSEPRAAAVESRALRFTDREDGTVAVHDAGNGGLIALVRPGEGGFLRGALRGLAHDRLRRDLGPQEPFLLTRFADGRLALYDQATGRRLDLDSFGASNADSFARLLK